MCSHNNTSGTDGRLQCLVASKFQFYLHHKLRRVSFTAILHSGGLSASLKATDSNANLRHSVRPVHAELH